jgi:hypothetical protein
MHGHCLNFILIIRILFMLYVLHLSVDCQVCFCVRLGSWMEMQILYDREKNSTYIETRVRYALRTLAEIHLESCK